jgi:hypothetical protein
VIFLLSLWLRFADFRHSIWEKKFGKGANHKVKVREAEAAAGYKSTRRSDSAAVRRPQSSVKKTSYGQRGQHPPFPQAVESGWERHDRSQSDVQSSIPASRPGTWESGGGRQSSLHPSWEAKKKLKEKQNAGILPPQGKKIKFL